MSDLQRFEVIFSNLTGCAVGISDIMLVVEVLADSKESAIDKAVSEACTINESSGMPPHGIRVSEQELRRLVV